MSEVVRKKVDHTLRPSKDHSGWTTSDARKAVCMKACGLDLYINAEADEEVYAKAFGPQEEDATFHASTVTGNTKAVVKAAEAIMAQRVKAEEPEEVEYDREGVDNLEDVWEEEAAEEAEAVRRSTMVIPSSISIPHVATGSAPKGKLIGKKDLVAEGEGSASASASVSKPKRVKKRRAADTDAAEGDAAPEGREPKKSKKIKKSKATSS